MNYIKRFFLFFIINIIVITTISIFIAIFRLSPAISSFGIDKTSLMIFCLIWGMGGSIISLLLSKKMIKWMMKIKIISSETTNVEERKIYETVKELTKKANLPHLPEIGIYHSKEVNAFATGPTKKNSLIAISSELVNKMNLNEIKGVLAHEITHIINGDMVTMTLLQGIINAFVMFLSRIIAYIISTLGKDRNRSPSFLTYHLFTMFFQTIFMIFGSIAICAFSRYREYKADFGGAHLAGKENMIEALQALRVLKEIKDPLALPSNINAFKISNFSKKSFTLFATHPSLEDRIEKLKNNFIVNQLQN